MYSMSDDDSRFWKNRTDYRRIWEVVGSEQEYVTIS